MFLFGGSPAGIRDFFCSIKKMVLTSRRGETSAKGGLKFTGKGGIQFTFVPGCAKIRVIFSAVRGVFGLPGEYKKNGDLPGKDYYGTEISAC